MMRLPTFSRMGFVWAWLFALTLSGCGFQLRGTAEVPADLTPAFVEGGGETAKLLRSTFESHGQELAATRQQARIVIRVLGEDRTTRVLSVNREGKVIAYELHYRVRFDAVTPDGAEKVPAQSIDLARDYVNPDTEVLGKQLEADQIVRDMQQDAAGQIIQRIKAKLR